VASERIRSLVDGLLLPDEVEPRAAMNSPQLYDVEAWSRVERASAEKVYVVQLLDVPDEAVHSDECLKLLGDLSKLVDVDRVGRTYAYSIRATLNNEVCIYYSSSYNDYARFEQLAAEVKKLSESINHMMWDTIQFLKYKAVQAKVELLRKRVANFYTRIPAKYIDVTLDGDVVNVYVPKQLKGYVIGSKGSTVQKLEQILGRRVRVVESPSLTSLYEDEHPEPPLDPEVMKLIAEVVPKLKELERKGVTLRRLEKFIELMERPEEDLPEGEGW